MNNIKIIQNRSKNICYYDNKFIIGKSLQENAEEDFDVLIFCVRNVKNVTIPKFIKIIGSYAFSNSSIENIFIPPNIVHIENSAFSNCSKLRKVEFASDSKIQ